MVYLPKMTTYSADKGNFTFEVPEFYNFGFDVIRERAETADKTAFIFVDRAGEQIDHHSFSDLDRASNRFGNALLGLGAAKGTRTPTPLREPDFESQRANVLNRPVWHILAAFQILNTLPPLAQAP